MACTLRRAANFLGGAFDAKRIRRRASNEKAKVKRQKAKVRDNPGPARASGAAGLRLRGRHRRAKRHGVTPGRFTFAFRLLPFHLREQVVERALEVRVEELEVLLDQPLGDAAAAFERERRLGPHEERAEAHEPRWHARAPRALERAAQLAHELGVGDGAGAGRVVDARGPLALDAPEDEAAEVLRVEPAYVLVPLADRAAEVESREPRQRGQRP